MSSYRHTQLGYVIIVCMILSCVITLIVGLAFAKLMSAAITTATFVILLACTVLFWSLTIEVGDGRLRCWFGPGLIRKSVLLDEIADAQLWKMSGIGGWGIHCSPQGWIYNVSGRRGVLFVLKNGKQFILGSDEPERLASAVLDAIGSGQR